VAEISKTAPSSPEVKKQAEQQPTSPINSLSSETAEVKVIELPKLDLKPFQGPKAEISKPKVEAEISKPIAKPETPEPAPSRPEIKVQAIEEPKEEFIPQVQTYSSEPAQVEVVKDPKLEILELAPQPAQVSTPDEAAKALAKIPGASINPTTPLNPATPLGSGADSASKLAQPSDPTLLITEVLLLGSIRAFPKTDLYDWLGPLIGRNVTFSQLEKAVGSITRNYRDRGYVAATALLPQQSFTGGRIEVMVYEGDLDPDRPVRFESKEGLRLNTEWAARIVKNAIGDEPIQQDSLERGLLMLQEIPGVSATVDLEPGLTQGTVRAAVVASEGKPVEGSLGANNMGAKSTGQNALSAEVRFNNALGQGEQLGFTYKPSEKKGQESYSLVSSIPVGDYGWRLGLNANHVTYRVDSDEDTQARGESDDITLTLRYPIQRSRALNQSLSVDLTAKRMSDYVNNETISEKSMSSVGATYSFDRTDLSTGNSLYGSVGLNLGKFDLTKNREAYEADQDGPKTHGGFSKTLINAGSSIRLPYNFILGISGSAQMASKNLNTSEKFGLGGPFGVRGYPVGEASGDVGWRISTELKRNLFTSAQWGSVGPMLFYDTGSVTRYKRPDGIIEEDQTNSYRLSGWGAGIFASKPNTYDFRLMWATKLGKNPGQRLDDEDRLIDNDGTNSKSRLWATFTYSF
jgi:hemolysin activation/secretion protein